MAENIYYGTGKRKNAIARVFMQEGKGAITINGKKFDEYLFRPTSRLIAMQSLVAADLQNKFDIKITTKGGGTTGQAGAIRLGIARALLQYDENLRATCLRSGGFLTRDSRIVERKKVGLRKARKKPQYSKR